MAATTKKLREAYIATCPLFGISSGEPGIDEKCLECQECRKVDAKMWQACRHECQQDQIVGEKKMDEKMKEVLETTKTTETKKTGRISRMDILIELVNDDIPRTKKELAEEMARRLPQFTAKQLGGLIGECFRFAIGIGVITKDENGRYVKRGVL